MDIPARIRLLSVYLCRARGFSQTGVNAVELIDPRIKMFRLLNSKRGAHFDNFSRSKWSFEEALAFGALTPLCTRLKF